MKKHLCNIFLLVAASVTVSAQTTLPVKKITLFKNSTGLFVKEGTAPVVNGSAKLPIPEGALFGTYFLGTGKDNAVKNLVFKNDTIKTKAVARSVWQYLAGNLNKQVTIYYTPTQGIDRSVSGKATDYNVQSGILKFTTDAGKNMVMHVANIYQADFKDDAQGWYMDDSVRRITLLKPEKGGNDIALQEIYMSNNINWIPSYYLRLKDDKNARLEMKATVENNTEDLKDAEMELVVGSPQMKYSSQLDPMTYDYITAGTGAGAGGGTYFQANMMAKAERGGAAEYDYSTIDFSTEGEKAGDMYIYKIGKVTLPKSSKGSFPIFAGNIEYKDKYEGTIPDFTNYYGNRFVPTDEKTYDVYHSLEVKNTSTVPLTTAAIMVVNEKEQFVAQDELKYTPVGSTSNIRLSKAIDIALKNSEEEKAREDNAKKIGKTIYSKVVLKGTINLDNYQDKAVTVVIKKNLNGTVTLQSDGGKTIKSNSYNYQNPTSEAKWEVKLGANEKKVLTYEYEVYFNPIQ